MRCLLFYPNNAGPAGQTWITLGIRSVLTEAVNELLTNYLESGKAMLLDCINATITFQRLANMLKEINSIGLFVSLFALIIINKLYCLPEKSNSLLTIRS